MPPVPDRRFGNTLLSISWYIGPEGRKIWQQTAGEGDRNDAESCMKWDVILNGSANYGHWPECRKSLREDGWSEKKILITYQAQPNCGYESPSTSMARRRPRIDVRAAGNVVAWPPEPRFPAAGSRKLSLVRNQEIPSPKSKYTAAVALLQLWRSLLFPSHFTENARGSRRIGWLERPMLKYLLSRVWLRPSAARLSPFTIQTILL